MKSKVSIVVVLVALGTVGYFLFGGSFFTANALKMEEPSADLVAFEFGSYGYRCADGTEFVVSPAADFESLRLVPATNVERIPETILARVESERGTRFEANGIYFFGRGETVEIGASDFNTTCLPLIDESDAPLNFGD